MAHSAQFIHFLSQSDRLDLSFDTDVNDVVNVDNVVVGFHDAFRRHAAARAHVFLCQFFSRLLLLLILMELVARTASVSSLALSLLPSPLYSLSFTHTSTFLSLSPSLSYSLNLSLQLYKEQRQLVSAVQGFQFTAAETNRGSVERKKKKIHQ